MIRRRKVFAIGRDGNARLRSMLFCWLILLFLKWYRQLPSGEPLLETVVILHGFRQDAVVGWCEKALTLGCIARRVRHAVNVVLC